MACLRKRRGRYVIDFYDSEGRRRWKTMPKDCRKQDAHKELRRIEQQLEDGLYLAPETTPVFQDVVKEWLEQKKMNVRRSYWETCEGITRNHFTAFQGAKINRIRTADVEGWIADHRKAGMHINTLRKCIVTLGQIMAYAVRHRLIAHNPVTDAERPREQGKVKKDHARIMTTAEIKALIDSTANLKYKTLFTLAIMSGARQGELLGLKWSDIDWESSQIHIQRTFNNQRWYDVKTTTSNRRIDLGPATMTALKKWKLACPKNRLNLVFPNDDGGPINHSNMRSRYFYPALKKAGIERIRFHDLRHTYASLLIEQGENIKYIQVQLGHSSPMVTLNVYAHLLRPVNQEAATKLEKAIF